MEHPEPDYDDELKRVEEVGLPDLPVPTVEDYAENEGAKIWYSQFAAQGPPVVLLHGGFGNAGNWAYQVPQLLKEGYNVVLIDSRGHGRSTWDPSLPYTYELMARDTFAVLDKLQINEKAAIVGWSDGACIGLIMAMQVPERVSGVFYFACNMDPSGTKEFVFTPVVGRCLKNHTRDYARLSSTPDDWDAMGDAVQLMQKTQPNCTEEQLSEVSQHVRVAIVLGEHDEFIKPEHAEYLARVIPNAELIILPSVSHFAPWQRPSDFNRVLSKFLTQATGTH
jgi:pimeloyl-ACP methyl ester carboxylesterase